MTHGELTTVSPGRLVVGGGTVAGAWYTSVARSAHMVQGALRFHLCGRILSTGSLIDESRSVSVRRKKTNEAFCHYFQVKSIFQPGEREMKNNTLLERRARG